MSALTQRRMSSHGVSLGGIKTEEYLGGNNKDQNKYVAVLF